MDGLIEGRIIHYVMPDGRAHRAAMIVQVFPQPQSDNPMCNITVFPDMLNDHRYGLELLRINRTDAEGMKGIIFGLTYTRFGHMVTGIRNQPSKECL
jgi:hypothetical protein